MKCKAYRLAILVGAGLVLAGSLALAQTPRRRAAEPGQRAPMARQQQQGQVGLLPGLPMGNYAIEIEATETRKGVDVTVTTPDKDLVEKPVSYTHLRAHET